MINASIWNDCTSYMLRHVQFIYAQACVIHKHTGQDCAHVQLTLCPKASFKLIWAQMENNWTNLMKRLLYKTENVFYLAQFLSKLSKDSKVIVMILTVKAPFKITVDNIQNFTIFSLFLCCCFFKKIRYDISYELSSCRQYHIIYDKMSNLIFLEK